jgi:exosortase/archaeosortase family protein
MHAEKPVLWRRPCVRGVRFIAISAVLAGVFLLAYREDVLGGPLSPWVELTAHATVSLLQWLGIEAVRTAAVIRHPGGFAYEIYYRCTGLLPAALLAILILAHPGSWRRKCLGLAAGAPLLVALNLVRLVHLFHLGVHAPGAFDLAHGFLWEAVLVLATIALWWGWRRWAARPHGGPAPCAPSAPSSVLPRNPLW